MSSIKLIPSPILLQCQPPPHPPKKIYIIMIKVIRVHEQGGGDSGWLESDLVFANLRHGWHYKLEIH